MSRLFIFLRSFCAVRESPLSETRRAFPARRTAGARFTEKTAAAGRELGGGEFRFAEPFAPQRDERRVSGTGDGVFAGQLRAEIAGDEVRFFSFCRDDDAEPLPSEHRHGAVVGDIAAHGVFAGEHEDQIAGRPCFRRRKAERAPGLFGKGDAPGRTGGELDLIEPVFFPHRENTGRRAEAHFRKRGAQEIHDEVSCRHRGVAAEVDLSGRREPAQVESVRPGCEKSRFGKSELRGGALHERRGEGPFRETDSGRISASRAGGEGFDDSVFHDDLRKIFSLLWEVPPHFSRALASALREGNAR